MEREWAEGVGNSVGKAEARVVRGGSQVIGSLRIGFKRVGPSGDTSEEVS